MPEAIPALVLAGGRASREFAAAAGSPHRALADINGRPMVGFVVDALRTAARIGRILVIGPAEIPDLPGAEKIAGEGSLIENIAAGIRACPEATFVLLVTADLPFLTGQAADDFIDAARAGGGDLTYAGIPRSACEAAFPGQRRTYIRLSGRKMTGGNLVLLRTEPFPRMAAAIQEAHERRKNPVFLARLIGLENALRLVTGRLETRHIEAGASRLLGVACRLQTTNDASVGTDVDKPEDLVLARSRLRPEAGG